VGFAVGEKGNKIEGGPAPIARASAEKICTLSLQHKVNQVVLEGDDRVGFRCSDVFLEKRRISVLGRELEFGALSHHGKTVKSEKIGPVAEFLGKRKNLIDIVVS
jgi:hypothetical protein